MTKEVMQQALDVLRGCLEHPDAADAIAELEWAIAQPVQPAKGCASDVANSSEFIQRTNAKYSEWCKTYYQADALDDRGMVSLHGLRAWQEQARRKMCKAETAQPVQPATVNTNLEIGAGAIYDFTGYLTSRDEKITLSGSDDATVAVDAIRAFFAKRGIGDDVEPAFRDWYLENIAQPVQPASDKLREIIAATYQILGAYDAPEHVLDVLADPEGATQAQIDALLPFVQSVQPEQETDAVAVLIEESWTWDGDQWQRPAQPVQPVQSALSDIEQYRLQMAGISTAAFGYWKKGDPIHPDYLTVALDDVADLYQKYDALFQKNVAQPAQPSSQNPKFTMDEWAAHARKHQWRFDEEPVTGVATMAQPVQPAQRPWVGLTEEEAVLVEEMQRMAKRILELEALLKSQTVLLERQTARIVDLQTHIYNFDGEGG